MAGKRELSGELLREIDFCLERIGRSHVTMSKTAGMTEYLNAGETARIEAGKIARLSGQLRRLWAWPKKKGGA